MQTILIIDNDLAFLFWLGAAIRDSGLQAIPAKNATAGRALLPQIGEDLRGIVVNPLLPGSGRLVRDLRRHYPKLRVVASLEAAPPEGQTYGADVCLIKPAQYEQAAVSPWLAALRGESLSGSAPRLM